MIQGIDPSDISAIILGVPRVTPGPLRTLLAVATPVSASDAMARARGRGSRAHRGVICR